MGKNSPLCIYMLININLCVALCVSQHNIANYSTQFYHQHAHKIMEITVLKALLSAFVLFQSRFDRQLDSNTYLHLHQRENGHIICQIIQCQSSENRLAQILLTHLLRMDDDRYKSYQVSKYSKLVETTKNTFHFKSTTNTRSECVEKKSKDL